MPQRTLRASAPAMPTARPTPTEKDFIDDLSYLPNRYAMPVIGDCLEPEIASGSVLIFDKTEAYAPGDLVILFRRRELVPAEHFQLQVKRLVMAPPPWVTFPWNESPKAELKSLVIVEMLNPWQQFAVPCGELLGIHKCLGIAPADVPRVKMKLPAAARIGTKR